MLSSTMEAQMIAHFKEAMSRMSDEEFLSIWDELNQEAPAGPDAAKLAASFEHEIYHANVYFNLSNTVDQSFALAGEYNFAMAAWAR